jgi:hypothetical protein
VPAQVGETVIGWGTGDCSSPTVTVSGRAASVIFPGRVEAGLCQAGGYILSVAPASVDDRLKMPVIGNFLSRSATARSQDRDERRD